MRYYAVAGALIGSGVALVTTGVVIWQAAESFARRGESHFLFPSNLSDRIR